MSTKSLDVVKNRLQLYRGEVEQWKVDHDRAMRCFDFQLLLHHGLQLYETINFFDERWRSLYRRGLVPFDQSTFDSINLMYSSWLETGTRMLRDLEQLEAEFGQVEHAEAFRSAVREVRGLLTPDEEFFSHDELVAARDDAIDSFRAGQAEVWE